MLAEGKERDSCISRLMAQGFDIHLAPDLAPLSFPEDTSSRSTPAAAADSLDLRKVKLPSPRVRCPFKGAVSVDGQVDWPGGFPIGAAP